MCIYIGFFFLKKKNLWFFSHFCKASKKCWGRKKTTQNLVDIRGSFKEPNTETKNWNFVKEMM
jgi:hypothetical protein